MSSLGGPIMGLFRLAYEYSPWFAALGAWWLLVAEITSRKAQALDPEPAAIQIEALAQESNVS
jgi:hypothetical protein